jgi:hypothetical protein
MERSRGVFTPFNSLVLEIVAVSKALAVASTAAIIAIVLWARSRGELEFCALLQLTH